MGSAYIPDGMLPSTENMTEYNKVYQRLRYQLDPVFAERRRKKAREAARKYREKKRKEKG